MRSCLLNQTFVYTYLDDHICKKFDHKNLKPFETSTSMHVKIETRLFSSASFHYAIIRLFSFPFEYCLLFFYSPRGSNAFNLIIIQATVKLSNTISKLFSEIFNDFEERMKEGKTFCCGHDGKDGRAVTSYPATPLWFSGSIFDQLLSITQNRWLRH